MTRIDEIDFLHVSYLFLEISEGLLLPPTPYIFLEIPEGSFPPHSLPIPGNSGGAAPPSLLTYSWNYRWGLLPPSLLTYSWNYRWGLLPPHSLPIPGTTGGGSSPPASSSSPSVDRLSTAIAKNTFNKIKLPQMNKIRK